MIKEQLELFLYWVRERHSIFLKKEAGRGRPWTADPILSEYKFTNPFRENDRVTRELRKRILKGDDIETIFTKTIIFRMFNWPETYDVLKEAGLVDKWSTAKAIKVLQKHKAQGNKVFTGAYIITNNGLKEDKISLVCKAIGGILKWRSTIITHIWNENSLEEAVLCLSSFSMVGSFIGYELVTDLRHTPILNKAKDIYTWANPGPGAKRGTHRILFNTLRGELPKGLLINNSKSRVDYQEFMQSLMGIAQKRLGKLKNFKGVKFEMRDIEHSLCEFDKYMRVKNGEGRPRGKYK